MSCYVNVVTRRGNSVLRRIGKIDNSVKAEAKPKNISPPPSKNVVLNGNQVLEISNKEIIINLAGGTLLRWEEQRMALWKGQCWIRSSKERGSTNWSEFKLIFNADIAAQFNLKIKWNSNNVEQIIPGNGHPVKFERKYCIFK